MIDPLPTGVAVHSGDPLLALGAAAIVNAGPLLRLRRAADADVLLVVDHVLGGTALDWLRRTRAGRDRPRAVLVTARLPTNLVIAAVEAGVAAVLSLEELGVEQLTDTVLAVRNGAAMLPPATLGHLLAHVRRLHERVLAPLRFTLSGCTTRELGVLRLLADGLSTAEIAAELRCSERTAQSVINELMERYSFRSRAHLVAYGISEGII